MKILFAVSNENISNTIVRNFQKKYNSTVNFKNVFYFNAITKELQKEKNYDCVVISEDLEPFANSNYDVIDKFILGRLKAISYVANDLDGRKVPIVLICTDRRRKSSEMVSNFFDLEIYNALIGSDRKIDEVCKLIASPRNKEDARRYYELTNGEQEMLGNDDVSELEVQNILIHYRRLGDDEDKIVESFNNIAAQYNDNQLRIIIRYLPIKVKAVLESECHKYQELVMNKIPVESKSEQKAKEKEKDRRLREKYEQEQILKDKIAKEQSVKVSKKDEFMDVKSRNKDVSIDLLKNRPKNLVNSEVIIPGNINTKNERKLFSDEEIKEEEKNSRIAEAKRASVVQNAPEVVDGHVIEESKPNVEGSNNIVVEATDIEVPKKKGRGRPRKNPLPVDVPPKAKGRRGRPRKNPLPEDTQINNNDNEEKVLPGLDDKTENNQVNTVLPGLDDIIESNVNSTVLPGLNDEVENSASNITLPGLDDEPANDTSLLLPGLDDSNDGESVKNNESSNSSVLSELDSMFDDVTEENESENINNNHDVLLPGFDNEKNHNNENYSKVDPYSNPAKNEEIRKIEENKVFSTGSLSSVLTPDKKIAAFIGTSKCGVSFLVNNLACLFSSIGVNTAILDMTKNKNSYYIYTDNKDDLRKIAYTSIEKLEKGVADGVKINRNLTVYTAIPNDQPKINNAESILTTLASNHSLVLIDCDYDTDYGIFANSQEIYLVQNMDVLTIQPLTTFLRELKNAGLLDSQKLRAVVNMEVKLRGVTSKAIIGGMSCYNDPGMSFMTELFNKDRIKACTIPFDANAYSKYLEMLITCQVSINGYSKSFLNNLKILGNMVYSLNSKQTYGKPVVDYSKSNFSDEMNNTLNQMRNKI